MTRILGSYDDRDVSLMAIDQYFRQVRWSAFLSREEETALLERVQRGKAERTRACPDAQVIAQTQAARDRLVEGFQPLVIRMVKRCQRWFHSLDFLDLVQEGTIGVIEAIEDYDSSKGYMLGQLVVTAIHHALCDARSIKDMLVRLPDKTLRKLSRIREVRRQLRVQLDRAPTCAELAHAAGMTEAQVFEFLLYDRRQEVESLQGLLLSDEDAEDRHNFVSLFEQEVVAEESRQEGMFAVIHQAMETALTQRQRDSLQLRYGEGLTYDQIGQRLGIEGGCVHSHEQRGVEQLRRVLVPRHFQTPDEFYTVTQVAQLAGVRTQRVYGWVRQGRLTAYPAPAGFVGYRPGASSPKYVYAKSEVDAFLQQGVA